VQIVEEALDPDTPVPADDAGRNFVAQSNRQKCRMASQFLDSVDELAADLPLQRAIVEKGDVLRPGYAGHDAQAVARRFVQEVDSRGRVRPDRVEAEVGHLPEVLGNTLQCGELVSVGVRRERSVCDAFDEKAFTASA
jgi:hypothetical protein